MSVKHKVDSLNEIRQEEQIHAEMLLNQCEILINQEDHDEVLAEILLNQLGV